MPKLHARALRHTQKNIREALSKEQAERALRSLENLSVETAKNMVREHMEGKAPLVNSASDKAIDQWLTAHTESLLLRFTHRDLVAESEKRELSITCAYVVDILDQHATGFSEDELAALIYAPAQETGSPKVGEPPAPRAPRAQTDCPSDLEGPPRERNQAPGSTGSGFTPAEGSSLGPAPHASALEPEQASGASSPSLSPKDQLKKLLLAPDLLVMPCCYNAFSARLIERSGFSLTFMSGFGVSAARLGLPDTGLISYAEMLSEGQSITDAVSIPVIGDADAGYGNALNVRRTVQGYARAGFACLMIEDQLTPKRCGHTRGKEVVGRKEALTRVRAAVEASQEVGNILVMARTDARGPLGLTEALHRAEGFLALGADIIFVEAPQSVEELATIARALPCPQMVNMLEQGDTPILPPTELAQMGFKIAAYPLTLLASAAHAMEKALGALRQGRTPDDLMPFSRLQEIVGFPEYDALKNRYARE